MRENEEKHDKSSERILLKCACRPIRSRHGKYAPVMYEFHSSECLTDWATCGLLHMPARRRGEGEEERGNRRGEVK